MDSNQILYQDKDIIVCYKPAGIATQTAKVGQKDMVSEVANYLAASGAGRTKPYVGLVHRLDQPVEGILVFAGNRKAADALSRQITENRMEKYYYAVVSGPGLAKNTADGQKATLSDYLYKDSRTNMSSVVPKDHPGAKKAELTYEIKSRKTIEGSGEIALVKIKLLTGRHHQIRVQFSHAGMSLLGDHKYADEQTKNLSERMGQKQAALCAYELGFRHPVSGQELLFHKEPEGKIFQMFL